MTRLFSCRSLAALVIATAWLLAKPLAAVDTPQSAFFHGNSLYAEGKYEEAAKQYESVIAGDTASAPLYFNLGNAYFKLGRRGQAILNYERALRWAPSDPDVEANLTFARELTGAEGCQPQLWQRLAFPLAGRFSSSTLGGWTLALFSAALFLLTAYRLWLTHPRGLIYAALACFAGCVLIGASLVFRLSRVEMQQQVVVVADGETPVRFEPAAGGTTHFTVKQGTALSVTDQREHWLQVQRCDGRRGWMEESSVGRM